MKAITEDSKNIVFYEGNQMIIKLVYSGRFSKKATLVDADKHVYEIVAVNFWKTRLEVRLDQQCLFYIKKKWTGVVEISSNEDSASNILLFKHKGFFKSRFVIQDKDEREFAVVRSTFRWKGFRYDFDIEVSDSLKKKTNHYVIIGVMIYLVRDAQRQKAGTAGATGGAIAAIT